MAANRTEAHTAIHTLIHVRYIGPARRETQRMWSGYHSTDAECGFGHGEQAVPVPGAGVLSSPY